MTKIQSRSARTSSYNKLVTVAVAFGSFVSGAKLRNPKLILADTDTDVWLLLCRYWQYHWPAWMVRILQPASSGGGGIRDQDCAGNCYCKWPLQYWRRAGKSFHHVGCHCTRPKGVHSDWCRLRHHWWCSPGWSCQFGVSPSRLPSHGKGGLTEIQHVPSR